MLGGNPCARRTRANERGRLGEYAAAFAVFLLIHAVPVRPPVKPWLVASLGRAGFGMAYSELSVAVLVWLIGAAARAPYVEVWKRAEWQNHVTLADDDTGCPDPCTVSVHAASLFLWLLAE
ncbi:NnrU family protein [Oricola nitratireducens]|uniref:NnrU family protein n=1 Tax=Oricola nitratireducens TaxID=2775868 RepID=UPI001AEE97C7